MSYTAFPQHFIPTLESDLESAHSLPLVNAGYYENDNIVHHEFWLLFGTVVERVTNTFTRKVEYFKVEGEHREITLNAHYGV